jgi:hypothetical protein
VQFPPTSSFSSGHTAASICPYGAITALALALTRTCWRWLVLTLAILAIVAVAVARLYRGAHLLTDVSGQRPVRRDLPASHPQATSPTSRLTIRRPAHLAARRISRPHLMP